MSLTESKDALRQYKCPNCGASIKFGASTQNMVCEYCGCELDVQTLEDLSVISEGEQSEIEWENYEDVNGKNDWDEAEKAKVKKYVCQSCGGSIITDDVTVATKCPYCDNPVVMPAKLEDEYRPDLVVPFKVSKEEAISALSKFLEGKKLLPDLFKDQNHIEEITGIYVPFWLFDSDVRGNVAFNATRTRSWTTGNYRYTKTSHYLLKRNGKVGFEKVPADGSSRMNDILMESIEPYDYTQAVDFNTAYLAGYLAENYDVKSDIVKPRIVERMSNSLISLYQTTVVGYGTSVITHKNLVNENGDIHYALLPVWLLNTKYKGQIYTFAMNGQSGKFVGNLPIDKGKSVRYFLQVFFGMSVVLAVIFLLATMFM